MLQIKIIINCEVPREEWDGARGHSESKCLGVILSPRARGHSEIKCWGLFRDHVVLRDYPEYRVVSSRHNNQALVIPRRLVETQQPSPSTLRLSTINLRPQLKRSKQDSKCSKFKNPLERSYIRVRRSLARATWTRARLNSTRVGVWPMA